MSEHSAPFSILTGFLGAGKTTVLNRVLAAPQGRRIAVLVNELGRIAIDSELILSRGGDVLELAGGCVCCKVDIKNDLWDGIIDVIERSRPDHVILETTGIAEPPAIIEGLDRMRPEDRARVRVAGTICVVDAQAGAPQLRRREEARVQVQCADRLLLSKLDVAESETVRQLHRQLGVLNPECERASFLADEAGDRALIPWLLSTAPHRRASPAHHHSHREGQIVAASFTDDAPLLAEPLLAVIEDLGGAVLRVKGFVYLADEPRRAFLEVAGVQTTLRLDQPWGDRSPRTELVIIGEELDEAALQRRLRACRSRRPLG